MPTVCPACGSAVREAGEAVWRCPNEGGCPAQRVEMILHAGRRGAMDIEQLGDTVGAGRVGARR